MFDWAKRKNLATYLITRFYESGAKRVRTADLLTASQALSQLSYSPNIKNQKYKFLKMLHQLQSEFELNHSKKVFPKYFLMNLGHKFLQQNLL